MGKWRKKGYDSQLAIAPPASVFSLGPVTLHNSDVRRLYEQWAAPTVIISDGPYGVSTLFGDLPTPKALPEWYEPHVSAWSGKSGPETTLWFWGTEIGWATVHPVLDKYGWRYVNCHTWDKGIVHAAGNSNTMSLRELPVVTEVCVQYVKQATIKGIILSEWLRSEWERTGIPLSKANQACGVRNAATRKYLTKDRLWYFPPPERFEALVRYANQHGLPRGKPYFTLDGDGPATAAKWAHMRAKFHCKSGITNVWREPPLQGPERVRINGRSAHLNQKPLKLVERIIELSSDPGDLVWEPFGGLCTGALASYRLGRRCVSAEIDPLIFSLAVDRLRKAFAEKSTQRC